MSNILRSIHTADRSDASLQIIDTYLSLQKNLLLHKALGLIPFLNHLETDGVGCQRRCRVRGNERLLLPQDIET